MQQLQQPCQQKKLTAEDYAYSLLLSYAAYQWPGYTIGKHHALIASKLQAVERGDIKRLIISMPPRHGKSMLASEFFPAWYIGRNPDKYIIAASYAQELADDFGRKVRNQLSDPCYGAIFPDVSLRDDSSSAKRFHTNKGGSYFAAGVGGPVTGRGAHLLLIDDPVKNREDAESDTNRRKIRDWYTSTAYTRLMPSGAIVIIMTRWHEDDLVGWQLEEGTEEWDVLELPAINEDGEALWPEQYSMTDLERIKRTLPARDWSALYQQRPSPEEGSYFLREWFNYYNELPQHLRYYIASDYATKDGEGDYTVHLVFATDPANRIYLVDLWRGQRDTFVWGEALIDLGQKYKPVEAGEEAGQIRNSMKPFLDRLQRERGVHFYRKGWASASDKQARAQSIRGMLSMGSVYFPANAPWLGEFERELLMFPNGAYDDQVDAFSLAGRMLSHHSPAQEVEEKKEPQYNAMTFNDLLERSKRLNRADDY